MNVCEKCKLASIDDMPCMCGHVATTPYKGFEAKHAVMEESINHKRKMISEELRGLLGDNYSSHLDFCKKVSKNKPADPNKEQISSYYVNIMLKRIKGQEINFGE